MTSNDEILSLRNQILNSAGNDGSALQRWKRTEEGQKVIQFVIQIGKYNTNIGEGKDILIGDKLFVGRNTRFTPKPNFAQTARLHRVTSRTILVASDVLPEFHPTAR